MWTLTIDVMCTALTEMQIHTNSRTQTHMHICTHICYGTHIYTQLLPHDTHTHLGIHGAVQLYTEEIHGPFGGLVRVDTAHIGPGRSTKAQTHNIHVDR